MQENSGDPRLSGEDSQKLLVAGIGQREISQATKRPSAKETDDAGFRFIVEQHRNQAAIAFLIIQVVVE